MQYLNVVAEGAYTTTFVTWNKLTDKDVKRIEGYAQEIYGTGIPENELGSSLACVVALLMGLDVKQYSGKVPVNDVPILYLKPMESYSD